MISVELPDGFLTKEEQRQRSNPPKIFVSTVWITRQNRLEPRSWKISRKSSKLSENFNKILLNSDASPKITLAKLSGIFIRFKLNLFDFEVTEVPDNYDGDSKQFLRSFMSIKVGFPTKEVPNDCNSDFEELWQKFVTIPTKGNLDVCNDWDNCERLISQRIREKFPAGFL